MRQLDPHPDPAPFRGRERTGQARHPLGMEKSRAALARDRVAPFDAQRIVHIGRPASPCRNSRRFALALGRFQLTSEPQRLIAIGLRDARPDRFAGRPVEAASPAPPAAALSSRCLDYGHAPSFHLSHVRTANRLPLRLGMLRHPRGRFPAASSILFFDFAPVRGISFCSLRERSAEGAGVTAVPIKHGAGHP